MPDDIFIPGHAPDGARIYAVGDIHGCAERLDRLHALIRADSEAAAEPRKLIVYLGDYIDRGPDSPGVVDRVMAGPGAGFERVALRGNHDDFLLKVLDEGDERMMRLWLFNGGQETLENYGVGGFLDAESLRRELARRVPEAHLAFFRGLALSHVEGGYIFVHAGLRPGRALADQDPEDLMWIREPFLDTDADFGRVVVHGHSPVDTPTLRRNRINLDTGAVYGGDLTAMAFYGAERRVLRV